MAEDSTLEKIPTLVEQWLQQDVEPEDETGNPDDEKLITGGDASDAYSVVEKIEETANVGATSEETGHVVEEDASEAQEVEEQEAVKDQPEIKIETAPADFRFPTTNQTRHCFTRYIEYHRCIAAKGEDASECNKFAKYYRSLCPGEWVERWNEQRENGTFPGPL